MQDCHGWDFLHIVKNVDTPKAAPLDPLFSRKIAALGTMKGKSHSLHLPSETLGYISPEKDVSKRNFLELANI